MKINNRNYYKFSIGLPMGRKNKIMFALGVILVASNSIYVHYTEETK